MKLLIDTHIALWLVTDSPKLSVRARALIADRANETIVSAISIVEVAIKFALRRGLADDMPLSGSELLTALVPANVNVLPLDQDDAAMMDTVSRLHGDPFDRLLIAQAINRSMTFVTHDAQLQEYGTFVYVV